VKTTASSQIDGLGEGPLKGEGGSMQRQRIFSTSTGTAKNKKFRVRKRYSRVVTCVGVPGCWDIAADQGAKSFAKNETGLVLDELGGRRTFRIRRQGRGHGSRGGIH
jgi:hypothetical protein